MGPFQSHRPVLLVMAAFSHYREALDWARNQAELAWGPVALQSQVFPFEQTTYYQPTMGPELLKTLLAFQQLVHPDDLADWKRRTNRWEQAYCQQGPLPQSRPLNLDPGYLTEAKLVLATTKDRDHRIYLRDGVFAEVTLYYHSGQWQPRQWTYPDYRQPEYHAFLDQCRELLRRRYREHRTGGQTADEP